MPERNDGKSTYWLQVFSVKTWQEFLDAGGNVTGFREKNWKTVQRMKPGDLLLCYLTKLSQWVAVLRVRSEPYLDTSTVIFQDEPFPCRVPVEIRKRLTIERAIPIKTIAGLTLTQGQRWGTRLMKSPVTLNPADAALVIDAIESAKD